MANPISQPSAPPQPNQEFYGVQELYLFKTYTRDSYRAMFGTEAPPYDPSRLIKSWFDSTVDGSDAGNVALYKILGRDTSGNWAIRQMVLPAHEAATVNLTGAAAFPPYTVPPTNATRGGSVLNASYLSLQSDANALMAIVGGDGLVDDGISAVFPILYPSDEPRRAWAILFKGKPLNVGIMLGNQSANGVGAPGHWDASGAEPIWVADPAGPTGLNDTRPPRDLPLRDLLANETLQAGPMGVGIVRTDLQAAAQQDNGLFTNDDRTVLRLIYQMVSKLAA